MTKVIFIDGKNIYLRPLDITDADGDYLSWINNRKVTRFLETGVMPINRTVLKDYIINMPKNRINLAICTKEDNMHIGNCSLTGIDWFSGLAEIGILIGNQEYWGKNIAVESYSLLISYAFDTLNLRKIIAGVVIENQGIIITLKKLGFQTEGRLRNHRFYDGKLQDVLRFGLFKNEFIPFED